MAQIEHLVTDRASGQSFGCQEGESLLGAAVRSGHPLIRVGCRAGGCGLCKVQVQEGEYTTGKMSRAHVSEAEEARGFVLACRTYPAGTIEFESKNLGVNV